MFKKLEDESVWLKPDWSRQQLKMRLESSRSCTEDHDKECKEGKEGSIKNEASQTPPQPGDPMSSMVSHVIAGTLDHLWSSSPENHSLNLTLRKTPDKPKLSNIL